MNINFKKVDNPEPELKFPFVIKLAEIGEYRLVTNGNENTFYLTTINKNFDSNEISNFKTFTAEIYTHDFLKTKLHIKEWEIVDSEFTIFD